MAFYRSIHGIDLPKLTGIELLNESFRNVGELKLVGMEELERVVIGDDSFMGSNGQFWGVSADPTLPAPFQSPLPEDHPGGQNPIDKGAF